MVASLLGLLMAAAMGSINSQKLLVIAQDCPLDLSWPNFTLAASACSNQNDRPKCCRYMNAFVAVSVARYAKTTGSLGVPPAVTDICLNSISQTLGSYGIPPNANLFCGLGTKIHVSYQCQGRATILDMLQSPSFNDVITKCKMPFSDESSCRRCLNSDIMFLRQLIGVQDNITLNNCRDAAFVALANQGDHFSAIDFASCFFSIKELIVHPVNASGPPSTPLSPAASPGPASSGDSSLQLLSEPPMKDHQTNKLKWIPGAGIVVTALAVVLLIIMILLIRKKRKELNSEGTSTEFSTSHHPQVRKSQEGPVTMFRRFSYKEIKQATDNFSNIIGKGGFSTVYKAQLDDGSIVAVKRMKIFSGQGEAEFYREMELIGRLHHRHLVALRGFCLNNNQGFLIYEFMENGSLKDHLHAPERTPLEWKTRIRIAIDVANALEYLHFYCDPPLCHNDIKAGNILLDANFLAKVADFGLVHASTSGAVNLEQVNKVIQVTPGYIDPEYAVTHKLTDKSDVYSYGVLLLELVTGKRAIQDSMNLVEWSKEFTDDDANIPRLVDPRIADSFDLEQLSIVVRIMQWCTEREGAMRPSMKQVLRLLSERVDPFHSSFFRNVEDEEGRYREGKASKWKGNRDEAIITFSGDARNLQSSSSTSRSYCSRSVLLENSPPHSPTGIFPV